nr:MAG TPA: hypothetical protein [Caudoviricetes sp.]
MCSKYQTNMRLSRVQGYMLAGLLLRFGCSS